MRYLARYVSKTALCESRLPGYDAQGNILLNCQSSATGQWSVITLSVDEFIRRWSQHVLPKGHMRTRHYGFWSAAAKARLERVRHLLGIATPSAPQQQQPAKTQPRCPCCGKQMHLSGRLDPLPRWRDLMHLRFALRARAAARGPPAANQAASA